MSSLLAEPRGIQSSFLIHSDRTISCCPHSADCSWTSAQNLHQGHIELIMELCLTASTTYVRMYQNTMLSVCVTSPASISQRANSPMRTSPFTVHFCVSQFGLQLWFINRDEFPFGPASITRSFKKRLGVFKNPWKRLCLAEAIVYGLWMLCRCYLGKNEHVKVGYMIFMGPFDSLLALFRVYNLSHVLLHKVTLDKTTNAKFYFVSSITQTLQGSIPRTVQQHTDLLLVK